MLTGTNPKLSRDIVRRSVRIRIDPKTDRAWLRATFKHDPLVMWAKAHRGELVRAALVLVQACISAGRPLSRARLGGFEDWAPVIGGVLEVCGVDAFLANANELYENADLEGQAWREFTLAWWDAHGEAALHVAALAELCDKHDLMSQLPRRWQRPLAAESPLSAQACCRVRAGCPCLRWRRSVRPGRW